MIVPKRLSAVGQVAGVAFAALCCYLVSQSVAAERAGLAQVDREISATHDDIAKLHTEIGVRGRMGQLERWNTDVLALQAPKPSQFVSDSVQLASLYGRKGQPVLPLDPAIAPQPGAPVQVAYQTAAPVARPDAVSRPEPVQVIAPPEPIVQQPILRSATYVRALPDRFSGAAQPMSSSQPTLQKASFVQEKPAAPVKKIVPATPSERKPAPRLANSLLPAGIGLLAEREAQGGKGSTKASR